jgi:hypothetical protein
VGVIGWLLPRTALKLGDFKRVKIVHKSKINSPESLRHLEGLGTALNSLASSFSAYF